MNSYARRGVLGQGGHLRQQGTPQPEVSPGETRLHSSACAPALAHLSGAREGGVTKLVPQNPPAQPGWGCRDKCPLCRPPSHLWGHTLTACP